MTPPVHDFDEILKDIPPGAWVALSHDEQRVVAYASDMRDAIAAANERGEQSPIILRAPLSASALFVPPCQLWHAGVLAREFRNEPVACRT